VIAPIGWLVLGTLLCVTPKNYTKLYPLREWFEDQKKAESYASFFGTPQWIQVSGMKCIFKDIAVKKEEAQ
jgi:hypothetical protein